MKSGEMSGKVAGAVTGAVYVVRHDTLPDGVGVVLVPCAGGYDTYKGLPKALMYEGVVYGATGFDSDLHVAYYRTDRIAAYFIG